MTKRPADMSADELREEIARCDHRAVVMGETMGGPWSQEARRLRRVLKAMRSTPAARADTK